MNEGDWILIQKNIHVTISQQSICECTAFPQYGELCPVKSCFWKHLGHTGWVCMKWVSSGAVDISDKSCKIS